MNFKLKGLIVENESWKGQVKQLEDENIQFKNQLVGILKTGVANVSMDHLESFQNRFIKMDEQIILLRHELREQFHLLQDEGTSYRKAMEQQKRLEVKMIIVQENFDKLRVSFHDYLRQVYL
ncbi:hypothetical protein [Chitinophaga vietnamensis]|uniref:hypothetical protein n=1 Tax=Chitinophaga vietnamensis TaxID=2593957 RepID=UPI0011787C30|nr:hypothetical protein [Chitinophaga vietnamensis]